LDLPLASPAKLLWSAKVRLAEEATEAIHCRRDVIENQGNEVRGGFVTTHRGS
jgi:hypothetical protein